MIDDAQKKKLVKTMAKLRMAHASTHGARKPPGNTFTTLNYDLVQADSTTLDKNVRYDLERLYSRWQQDEEFDETFLILISLKA